MPFNPALAAAAAGDKPGSMYLAPAVYQPLMDFVGAALNVIGDSRWLQQAMSHHIMPCHVTSHNAMPWETRRG